MCAISGVLNLKFDKQTLEHMQQTMSHRGPDATGSFLSKHCVLLHSRLAIVDPQHGSQPMRLQWKNREYVIVYNGELYNTDELRSTLRALGHDFEGWSDTEVVLHAYAQWEEAVTDKLNGIFAFAVWECKNKKLYLARDRIGVKPLFYKLHEGGLLFASEIKTILAYPTVKAELEAQSATALIMLGPGRIPGSGVFKDVLELEPGCCGTYQDGCWSKKCYWKLKDREHTDTFEETVEKVRYLLTDSIERQMVSDVPIGTFLSGGLDSSIITAVCAEKLRSCGEKLQTFSVDYRDHERYFKAGKFQPDADTKYIRFMQEYIDSEHHWSILEPKELADALELAMIARDLPGMADVDSSLLVFCSQVRQYVKVALSGECADEIFGGYPWYRDPQVRMQEGFPWAQNTKYRAGLLRPEVMTLNLAEDFVHDLYSQTIAQADVLPEQSETERRMRQMFYMNFRWFMQTLLDRKDRMSMHNGLEVRVPFCDYRIAEYLYSVPWEYKDFNGYEKGLLRYAMEDRLPAEILWRKKSPYPKTHDPQYTKLVSDGMRNLLAEKDEPIFRLVQPQALEALLQSEQQWPWYGQLMKTPQTIAYMLQLNSWLKTYNVSFVY